MTRGNATVNGLMGGRLCAKARKTPTATVIFTVTVVIDNWIVLNIGFKKNNISLYYDARVSFE